MTTEDCLGTEIIRSWFNGKLSPINAENFRAHLARCPKCKKELVIILENLQGCFEETFMLSWLKGRLTPRHGEEFRTHLTKCALCRKTLSDVMKLEQPPQ